MASSELKCSMAFRDFLAFCSRYSPGFDKKITGASNADVDRLERLAGSKLPPEYRSFLECMGRTPSKALGPFLEHVTYGVAAVEEYYRDPPLPVPRSAIYLWTYEFDSPNLIFLPVESNTDGGRPLLQFGWPVDPNTGQFVDKDPQKVIVSDGLLPFLYGEAFEEIRRPSLRFGVALEEANIASKPDERLAVGRRKRFSALMGQLGFTLVPYMERNMLLFNRDDAAAAMASEPYAADSAYVGANSERECAHLAELLIDNLDMRPR